MKKKFLKEEEEFKKQKEAFVKHEKMFNEHKMSVSSAADICAAQTEHHNEDDLKAKKMVMKH